MTQDAVVIKTYPNMTADVAVTRGTACGSNCGNCESCIYQNEMRTRVINKIGASAGQNVEIESRSALIYKAEFLVYILPMILMLAGYLIPYLLGAYNGICVLTSFAALAAGAVFLVASQKNKKQIQPVIVRIKNQ